MLFRHFEIESNISKNQTIEAIRNLMDTHFTLFPKKILRGRINNSDSFKATINAPFLMSDPFKNVAIGELSETSNRTKIKLKIRFGIINMILCFFFYIPIIFNLDSGIDWRTFGLLTAMNLIIVFLLYMKLRWDSNRLIRKLNESIK